VLCERYTKTKTWVFPHQNQTVSYGWQIDRLIHLNSVQWKKQNNTEWCSSAKRKCQHSAQKFIIKLMIRSEADLFLKSMFRVKFEWFDESTRKKLRYLQLRASDSNLYKNKFWHQLLYKHDFWKREQDLCLQNTNWTSMSAIRSMKSLFLWRLWAGGCR